MVVSAKGPARPSWADGINRMASTAREAPTSTQDPLVALIAARHVSIRDRRGRDGRVIVDGSGRVTREVWADGDMIGERKSWPATRRLAIRAGEMVASGDLVALADLKRAEMDRESRS